MANDELRIEPLSLPELLQSSGLKVTKIRIAILEFLTEGHGPFTAQQIYQAVLKHGKLESVDLVSVYRNLEKFVTSGLVVQCLLADGTSRFEFGQTPHHHHIVCTSCKRVDPMLHCPLKLSIDNDVAKGYTNLVHKLEFHGICPDCQKS